MTQSLKKFLLNKTQSDYFLGKLNKICYYSALALQLKILTKELYLNSFETSLPRSLLLQAEAEKELGFLCAAPSNLQGQLAKPPPGRSSC